MVKLSLKKILWTLILISILVVTIPGYFIWKQSSYTDYQVKKADLKTFLSSSGRIKAEKEANLEYNSAGWVTDLPVKENDLVEKDQIVAKIDPTEAIKNVAAANAAHRTAEASLTKIIDDIHLFQYGNGGFDQVGSANETQTQKMQRQQAEDAVNTASVNLQKAQYTLSRTVLKAPFAGVVTKVNAQLNESTSAFSQEPIVQIVDFSTLYFGADIDQESSGLVKVGQTATVTLDALKDSPLTGTISEVANSTVTTAENDTVIPVKIALGSIENLKLGWKGDVKIDLKTLNDVLLIPKQAVEYANGQSVVRVKDGISTKTKPVTLGEFDGINWQVTHGLQENESILVKR